MYTLAEEHGLLPLLHRRLTEACDSTVLSDIRQRLEEFHRAHVIFTLRLIVELFQLLDRFAAANLELVVIKGPVWSLRCYGDPGARQYSDLDLIVRTKDIQRSTEIMAGLGYAARIPLKAIADGKMPGEYVFTRADTNLLIEFHTEDTFRYHPRRVQLDKVFARKTWVVFDQHRVPALSVEDELVFVCVHSAKHLWERLAWVADVAALLSRGERLDWQRTISAANEVGAERMLRVGILLAATMLGSALLPEVEAYAKSDAAAIRLAEHIAARLAHGDSAGPGIISRAAFRMKMRGGFLPGLSYLLRLSLSPTEDDWSSTDPSSRAWILDAMSRPFRLARKYRGEAGSKTR